jgi:hypothetical protein
MFAHSSPSISFFWHSTLHIKSNIRTLHIHIGASWKYIFKNVLLLMFFQENQFLQFINYFLSNWLCFHPLKFINSFIKGMVVSLTKRKVLKLQNMFDKMKIDHQHFCKNQNSKSNEKGSNVKIDRVENFKDPLSQCTSQNKSWKKRTSHKQ